MDRSEDTGALSGSRASTEPQSPLSLGPSGFDPERLAELAERCERASGADRELDARIHCEVRGWQFTASGNDFIAIVPGIIPTIQNRLWLGQRDPTQIPRSYNTRTDAISPAYTASMDAAMKLAPEGWFMVLDDLGADGMPLATLHTPEGMRKEVGIARNLTLALCAAALRAIAMEARQGGDANAAPSRSDDSAGRQASPKTNHPRQNDGDRE